MLELSLLLKRTKSLQQSLSSRNSRPRFLNQQVPRRSSHVMLACAHPDVWRAGNAPTLMSVKHLKKVAPMWMNVSKAIFDDTEAHEVRCCRL